MKRYEFLIENSFAKSEEFSQVVNPFTQETVHEVYKSSAQDIDKALNYLRNTFQTYKEEPSYVRAELLERVSGKIKDRSEELAQLLSSETSKPVKFSRIEVDRAIFTFKTGSEEAKRIHGEHFDLDLLKGSENKTAITRRFPLGIILAITPWNFPINLVAHKLSPALAAGNTVLLKPASASVGCGIELVKMIHEVCSEMNLGYCPVNVVNSSGSVIEQFVRDERVKMVSFTGSPAVGWNLKKKVSHQKISLELGGNAGVIVDKDADLNTAADKIASGGFAQAGQSCISVQRVFIHKDIYDSFLQILLDKTVKIKTGNPFDDDTIVSAMINEDEAKRAEEWINEASRAGAKTLTGGKRKGAVLEPTIIIDAGADLNVNCKEVFAPVITLSKFTVFKEAVKSVDESDYGLQAGVFTNNLANALYAFKNIETGGVIINDVSTYRMDAMPYGGVKHSGMGREGIRYAIEEMTEMKLMVFNL